MSSNEKVPVTREGLAKLKEEYEHLVNNERPRIVEVIAEARSHGDLRENAAYDAAKHDQGIIEGRIRELERMLKRVEIIDESSSATASSNVRIGSTVTIEVDGEEEKYTIVGAVESRPAQGRISNESPFGKALLGRKVGDEVTIETPGINMEAKILRIE
ncbi:MAG: transcription elongation factor GreA [Sphaerobacteraceae bacterium]|nr:MAG: transcription elongation factor GreA [Sphaerobacteraceae bacterium]